MGTVELLQAYFQKKHLIFEGDPRSEIQCQNKQSLAPYLYFVYGEQFKNVYLAATLIQQKFYFLQEELTALFNQHEISHFFIKGSILSKIYPDPALRTRGDIDIVVKKEDYHKAKLILAENKYSYVSEQTHHAEYLKNNLMIELHRELFSDEPLMNAYFDKFFEHIILEKNYLYSLEKNYHFIYCVCHLNKHLINGEGLRYLLDFYYMMKSWDLDYIYIEQELEKLDMLKLYHNICDAIFVITNEKMPGYQGKNFEVLIRDMVKNGIHVIPNKEKKILNSLAIQKKSKFSYICSTLFLPNKFDRKRCYPRLSKWKVLYPVLLIHRSLHLTLFRIPNLFRVLFLKKETINEVVKRNEEVGIIK